MSDPRGQFDIIVGNIVSLLESYSQADSQNDPSYVYTVTPDFYRVRESIPAGAHVFVYAGTLTPADGGNATAVAYQHTAQYLVDCIVAAKGKQNVEYDRADKLAGERLRYLQQQVLTALNPATNWNLGLGNNQVARRTFPRVEPLPPDAAAQQGEKIITGARLTFDVTLVWEPTKQTGETLDSIDVDETNGYYSALFTY